MAEVKIQLQKVFDNTSWTTTLLSTAALTTSGALIWLLQDYNAWLAFGTGGTPPNFRGYLKINKFRILRFLSGDDLRDPSRLSSEGKSYIQGDLPKRKGPRPKIISRTLPQRQHPASVPLDEKLRARLHALPKAYAAKHVDLLVLDKSATEGRSTDAIYVKPKHKAGANDPVLQNEIAHVHPAEDSLHVWLTEADAKKVVQAGWAERFPLSSLGMTHNGWTFLYAPRSDEEIDVVERIVRAGIGHLTGKVV